MLFMGKLTIFDRAIFYSYAELPDGTGDIGVLWWFIDSKLWCFYFCFFLDICWFLMFRLCHTMWLALGPSCACCERGWEGAMMVLCVFFCWRLPKSRLFFPTHSTSLNHRQIMIPPVSNHGKSWKIHHWVQSSVIFQKPLEIHGISQPCLALRGYIQLEKKLRVQVFPTSLRSLRAQVLAAWRLVTRSRAFSWLSTSLLNVAPQVRRCW